MNPNTLIDTTPPGGEAPKVEGLLAPFAEMFGTAPAGLRLLGVSPPVLENYVHNIGYYLGHAALSPPLLAMIRYLVSADGGCRYCVDLNGAMLAGAGLDLDRARAAHDDLEQAPFAERERALLGLVMKAVGDPHGVTAADLEGARAHGWSDRDLFDAIWHGHGARAFGNVMESFGLRAEGAL